MIEIGLAIRDIRFNSEKGACSVARSKPSIYDHARSEVASESRRDVLYRMDISYMLRGERPSETGVHRKRRKREKHCDDDDRDWR